MNKQSIILALGLGLLSPLALAAKSPEQAYIDSYAAVSGTPKPVSVVSPPLRAEWVGESFSLVFVVDANGRPRGIKSATYVKAELARRLIDAVSRWKFEPARDANGQPRAAKVLLPVQIVEKDGTTRLHRIGD